MKGKYVKHESGAFIAVPSDEELKQNNLRKLILQIHDALPKGVKDKIDPALLEVVRNG